MSQWSVFIYNFVGSWTDIVHTFTICLSFGFQRGFIRFLMVIARSSPPTNIKELFKQLPGTIWTFNIECRQVSEKMIISAISPHMPPHHGAVPSWSFQVLKSHLAFVPQNIMYSVTFIFLIMCLNCGTISYFLCNIFNISFLSLTRKMNCFLLYLLPSDIIL